MLDSAEDETKKVEFETRRAVWVKANVAPMVAAIRAYAGRTGRGQPQAARAYLRDHADKVPEIATESLRVLVAGVTRQEGLTNVAANIGRHVGKKLAKPMKDEAQAIQVGMMLLSIIGQVTGALEIVDKHGDRPEKAAGGVRVTPTYEMRIIKASFLSDAVKFGAAGMPTFVKGGAADWTAQKVGGAPGQAEHGLVHSAGAQMREVTSDTAPVLFQAVNDAQAARFRVSETIAGVIQGYDKAKEATRLHTLAAQLPQDCAAFYMTSPANGRASLVSVHIDAMFVAQLTGVPTLNGYSGQEPKGWAGLYYVRAADYREQVRAWVQAHGVRGRVCELANPD